MLSSKSFVLFFLWEGEGGPSNFCLCGQRRTMADWCEDRRQLVSGLILAGGEKVTSDIENRNEDKEITHEIHFGLKCTRTWGYSRGGRELNSVGLSTTCKKACITAGVTRCYILYSYSGTLVAEATGCCLPRSCPCDVTPLKSKVSLAVAKGVLLITCGRIGQLLSLRLEWHLRSPEKQIPQGGRPTKALRERPG